MGRRKRKRRNLVGKPEDFATPPPDFNEHSFHQNLMNKANELGLFLAGVTTPEPAATFDLYKEWLAQGFHGEMGYLARADRLERREDLSVVLNNVQAVLVVGMAYWPGTFPQEQEDPERGAISCYAWGEDYHDILGEKLRSLAHWMAEEVPCAATWYVDTGALQERELGARAGLGFVGKNTMLIHPKYGSGFFLGEILTTLPLMPHEPKAMPSCGSCTRCLVACPTDAFVGPFVLDARRCISYLTIELKGSIPHELRKPIGNRIYGCDICQQVCPWSKFAGTDQSPPWGDDIPLETTAPNLEPLMTLNEDQFNERFEGSPIQRLGRARFLRNVAVALGNAGLPSSVRVLEQALNDKEELIREHAGWALSQIRDATS